MMICLALTVISIAKNIYQKGDPNIIDGGLDDDYKALGDPDDVDGDINILNFKEYPILQIWHDGGDPDEFFL